MILFLLLDSHADGFSHNTDEILGSAVVNVVMKKILLR